MTIKKKTQFICRIKARKDHKAGKMTLRTHKIEKRSRPTISPAIILDTRENLHMSRAVFAIKLGVSVRTLEKWEQGKIAPMIRRPPSFD